MKEGKCTDKTPKWHELTAMQWANVIAKNDLILLRQIVKERSK